MAWQVEVVAGDSLVELTYDGGASADDFTMSIIETCFMVSQYGVTRVMLDFSKARMGFSTESLQRLLEIYREYLLDKSTRSAVLLPAVSESAEPLVELARQYGCEVGFFQTGSEAREWLLS